jgi:hypothetical protein
MGDETVWDSFWPGGLGIYRDVSSNVQQFPAPYLNGSYHTTPSNWTDQEKPYPGWQWMYAVDNATARPIAVIGEVECPFVAGYPLNIYPFIAHLGQLRH